MKLIIFDFDDTLFFTPNKTDENLEKINQNRQNKITGWWGRPESLDMKLFDIPINQSMCNVYNENITARKILVTGRIKRCSNMVKQILDKNELYLDKLYFCDHRKTVDFKMDIFEKEIGFMGYEDVEIYDDRKEHIEDFINLVDRLNEQGASISFFNVDGNKVNRLR